MNNTVPCKIIILGISSDFESDFFSFMYTSKELFFGFIGHKLMMCPRGFFDYMESRELKLTKLEADFYRANSSTRNESIELHGIRICLLQELVEIEETKNVELSNRIQDHQVCADAYECRNLVRLVY